MKGEPIVRMLRRYALPDPYDERESIYAPILAAAADEIDRLAAENAELKQSNETAWSTLIALADKLGISPEEARKKPGKPSDVYMQRLKKAEARIAELERDALRYQYLKNNADDLFQPAVVVHQYDQWGELQEIFIEGERLDAAIDAALERSDDKEKNNAR